MGPHVGLHNIVAWGDNLGVVYGMGLAGTRVINSGLLPALIATLINSGILPALIATLINSGLLPALIATLSSTIFGCGLQTLLYLYRGSTHRTDAQKVSVSTKSEQA